MLRTARAAAVPALAAALLAAGCGKGDSAQVRDTVTAFRDATAKKDFDRICRKILAPALVTRLTDLGLPCQVALAKYLTPTSEPTINVSKVVVRGTRAQAFVATGAKGQGTSRDVVQLVKTGGGWRIASLSSPGSGGE